MEAFSIDGLTMPSPGIAVLRAVMNRHWKQLVATYFALRSPAARLDLGATDALRALLARDPRRVVRVLRRPTVAAWLGAARRTDLADHELYLARVHALDLAILTELAVTGALPEPRVVRPPPESMLRSIAWRRVAQVPVDAEVRFANGAISIVRGGVSEEALGERAYFELVPDVLFATSDDNPLLPVQGHPEREGNTVDLGGFDVDAWLEALRASFAILERHAPATMDEMRLALELVVPVGYDAERHASVSYRDSVGAVYMTLHPNRMTLAEALIHEFQHNKLNAVLSWDPVLIAANEPVFDSPVRPDKRPLLGVLMAAHAFLPVARLYEAIAASDDPIGRGHDFTGRFQQIVKTNHEAATTVLAHARPTPLGKSLLAEIGRWDAYYVAYADRTWGGLG